MSRCVLCLLPVLAVALAGAALLPETSTFVPEDEAKKIQLAVPSEPVVKPQKPRRVLIYSNAPTFAHGSIPWGKEALQQLGKTTGAYEPVFIDDPAVFVKDRLAEFDAVLFNNNCHSGVKSKEQREALLTYIREGGGFVGIHCAAHSPDWEAFTSMIGGLSVSHPWGPGDTVTIQIEEPKHPLMQTFSDERFEIDDEIYVFEHYSRDKVRVLFGLDTQRTDMTKPGITRTDGDFALCWIRNYGKGRVFYSALGHRNETYSNPAILKHYLAGIQFACGDLVADATPRKVNDTDAAESHQDGE